MLDQVRAIAFDSYGTLFDTAPLARAAARVAPGRGEELATLWRQKQLAYAWIRTLTGRYQDFWQITGDALSAAAAHLGTLLSRPARFRLLQTYLELPVFPDVPETVAALAGRAGRPGRPLRLGLLSQGTPEMLAAVIRRNGLEAYLAAVVSADAAQRYKPAPEPYRLLAGQLGAAPGEILYVTAHGWDLAGAVAAGFQTGWLNRQGEPPEALGVEPTVELTSLSALVQQ